MVVVDYGSQYTMLIARRLRELGVFAKVVSHASDLEGALADCRGVVLSGGPESVHEKDAPGLPEGLIEAKLPVLGVCYGMHALAVALGGEVVPCKDSRGYGSSTVSKTEVASPLFAGIDELDFEVWMSHGDQLEMAPPGCEVVATARSAPIAAFEDASRHLYGIQFHPEVTHTPQGDSVLLSFVRNICGHPCDWSMPAYIQSACSSLGAMLGDDRVLLALSGGVDSAVAAALLERAVPGNVVCVLVDSGLMRSGEVEQVRRSFAHLGERLMVVDAASRFLQALGGVTDPEEKRKAIGSTFIDVFVAKAKELGQIRWLGQGTIYPDVVESAGTATGHAAVIKSHHNVGGLPERLGLELVEPLRMLFKDEVRKLGEELGLGHDVVWRHPFPGPGLAVRVLGAVTRERLATVRAADVIFLEELRAAGEYDNVAQAFAVLLPVSTVGVQGDGRTYENVVALRAVVTTDFMTADWARLPPNLLARCSTRIINEVQGVNRVVYDVSSKPPATVEWE